MHPRDRRAVRFRRSVRREGRPERECRSGRRRARGSGAGLRGRPGCVRARDACRVRLRGDRRGRRRSLRDRHSPGGRMDNVLPGRPGRERRPDSTAPPLWEPRRTRRSGDAPGGMAAQPSRSRGRGRGFPATAAAVDGRARLVAHLRPRPPATSRRGRRGAVVHDLVRTRLAPHVVDGADRGSGPGARNAPDPGRVPGPRHRRAYGGATGPHAPRDPIRRADPALARRRERLLRHRGRDSAVRDAAGRAGALGSGASRHRRAASRGGSGAGLDRRVRGPGWRRLRRIPACESRGPRASGMEGLVGLDPVRER